MSDNLTPSLHDQLSDTNTSGFGLPDTDETLDPDGWPDEPLTDEDLNYLADTQAGEGSLVRLLERSIEIETAKRGHRPPCERMVNVPESLLRDVLEMRKLFRTIENWKLEGDEREEARYRAEQIEKAARKLLGRAS